MVMSPRTLAKLLGKALPVVGFLVSALDANDGTAGNQIYGWAHTAGLAIGLIGAQVTAGMYLSHTGNGQLVPATLPSAPGWLDPAGADVVRPIAQSFDTNVTAPNDPIQIKILWPL